jgi:glutamate decarboxylase
MALHTVRKSAGNEFADAYSTALSEAPLPKHRIPDGMSDPRVVHDLIRDELAIDGNSSQNLATFCTTWADAEVHQLMDESLDKNMVDKDEYPQTAAIESRCVHIMADLWHSPDSDETIGCSTTGSSEAAMLGGLALKWRWRARREAAGLRVDGDPAGPGPPRHRPRQDRPAPRRPPAQRRPPHLPPPRRRPRTHRLPPLTR